MGFSENQNPLELPPDCSRLAITTNNRSMNAAVSSPVPPPPAARGLVPAAAYVRMSTEHQQYSTENQLDRIKDYAARRGLDIVHVFTDAGKSGLNARGRDGLRQMLEEVQSGQARFKCILAYDVSRWGRFQDMDESGYYEYLCRRIGIAVHYCAEQFENDGSPASNIIKSVKRTMAGEYSRELSTKVFQGACRLSQLGYKQGGNAGFGLRRMLIDATGATKGLLKIGERKSLQTDRVVLVQGPAEEQQVVREIYHAFVADGKSKSEIAADLNRRQIRTDFGRLWTRNTIHQILTNEKYIGHNLYHRTSNKLRRRQVRNPPDLWFRAKNVFPPTIDEALFNRAQLILRDRARSFTDEAVLDALRAIFARHGRITADLIATEEDLPSKASIARRFGGLVNAYQLAGYTPHRTVASLACQQFLLRKHPEIIQEVVNRLASMSVAVDHDPTTDLLIIDRELSVSVLLARCLRPAQGRAYWLLRFETSCRPDLTVAVRLDETNQAIKDYYLFPALDRGPDHLRLKEGNHALLDSYRFDDLELLFDLAARISVEHTAS